MTQLQRAGLLQSNTRARRNLLEAASSGPKPPSLNPEQEAQLKKLQSSKQEQLTAAKALLDAKLPHLATPHLQNTVLHQAQITAIQTQQTPPESLDDLETRPHASLVPETLSPFLEKHALTSEEAELFLKEF